MSSDKKTPFSEATVVQPRQIVEVDIENAVTDNSPLEPPRVVHTMKVAEESQAASVTPPPNPRARNYSKLQRPDEEDPDFSTVDAGASLGSVGKPARETEASASVVATEAPVQTLAQSVANAIAATASAAKNGSSGAIVGGAAASPSTSTPAPAKAKFEIKHEEPDRAPVSERTMVYAQESLNDTFDARTVVRPKLPKEAPSLPTEAPALLKDTPDEGPVGASSTEDVVDDVEGHSRLINASDEARKMTPEERRALRAKLDRRTRQMFIAFAVVGVIGLIVLLHALTTGPATTPNGVPVAKNETNEQGESPAQKIDEKRDIASTAPPKPVGNAQTTADLLGKFELATLKTQEQVREYSKSGSGF